MAFCSNCGKPVTDAQDYCMHCGCKIRKTAAAAVTDTDNFGWAVLGFFVPIVGLILWLLWKDSAPKNAKKAGLGALVGAIASVVFVVLFYILYFVLMFAILAA